MIRFLMLPVILFALTAHPADGLSEPEEEVIFYTTYGYSDGDEWAIPMRVYVMEDRNRMEGLISRIMNRFREMAGDEDAIFRSRIADFIADSESREVVVFMFDDDPEEEHFHLTDENDIPFRTNLNGFKEGVLRLPADRARQLLEAQGSENGWLTFRAVSDEHGGNGRVRLIDPDGISVISDVDDTVKITEITAGSRIVVRNTFFKTYSEVPGMAEMYNNWEAAAFHYVSGSPWQLYRPLREFLFDDAGFPEGSFHMKTVSKNMISVSTWRGLANLVTNENVTYEQKLGQIREIIEHFPARQFILAGDSGERDPEIYGIIREEFPDQIKKIIIRDVVNAREKNPERLEGMTVIPAETIREGVSQFES